jgi:hypothetical protein
VIEWLCKELRLLIAFIEQLQNVTTKTATVSLELLTPKITANIAHINSSQFSKSSSVVCWWRIPIMSSASVLSFLPAGDCLTTNSLLQLSTLTFKFKVEVTLRLAVYRQSVRLGAKLSRFTTRDFLQLNSCSHSPFVTSTLTKGWVCRLWLCRLSTNCPAYIPAWTAQKTLFLCCCFQLLQWKHACLRSLYSVIHVVYSLISRSLPSNGSICRNI